MSEAWNSSITYRKKRLHYGLKYVDPQDFYAAKMQERIKEKGIRAAAAEILGVADNEKLLDMVMEEYGNLG